MNKIDFTIIIPHRNSLDTLKRLFDSIPDNSNTQVILIDNSVSPISYEEVETLKQYTLIHSAPERYAGGARNVGIDAAKGEWLIFADADDFFTAESFAIFNEYKNSPYDLIYFKANSVYDDTLEPSDRGAMFSEIIDQYMSGKISEIQARVTFAVPWAKMVRKSLVENNNIRFDEVIAANDVYFSLLTGFYSKHFAVDSREVYTVTVRKGSLSKRRDFDVIHSRYLVFMRRNKFLKEQGLPELQISVMYYIYLSLSFGLNKTLQMLWEAFKFKQNIFIGRKNWIKTFRTSKNEDNRDKKYIIK